MIGGDSIMVKKQLNVRVSEESLEMLEKVIEHLNKKMHPLKFKKNQVIEIAIFELYESYSLEIRESK